jgi:hypothetical protein
MSKYVSTSTFGGRFARHVTTRPAMVMRWFRTKFIFKSPARKSTTKARLSSSRRAGIGDLLCVKHVPHWFFNVRRDDVHQGCVRSRILTCNQLVIHNRMRLPDQSRGETAVWVANSSVDAADSYFAGTASSDNTLPRYNVNTFLNSATTRTFPLGSASP